MSSNSTSNGTSATSNGTTATSNGVTSNGTTATSNGTTATSNGTTATSNGTTSTSNGTTSTSNGTTTLDAGMPDVPDEPDAVSDTGNVEPDVPLIGPRLVVDPDELINFGEAGLFVSIAEELVLRNEGDAPLTLESVQLESEPSEGFLVTALSDTTVLEPGEEAVFRVRFRPTRLQQNGPTGYNNAVIIETNDPENSIVSIRLEGIATPGSDVCLTYNRNNVFFGDVAPGSTRAEDVSLRNCGERNIDVEAFSIIGGNGVLEYAVGAGSMLPMELEPGEQMNVALTYAPNDSDPFEALLVADTAQGISAELRVTGGSLCPTAVATAQVVDGPSVEGSIDVEVGELVELSASGSFDPSAGFLTYRWSLTPPENVVGPVQIDPDLESERFTFVPPTAGEYRASLVVINPFTGLESCNTDSVVITATGEANPVVSVTVVLTWDNVSDMDIHVVRSDANGNFSEEFGRDGDGDELNEVYWNNTSPDWGGPGDSDNPLFDVDDTDGFGPETIMIPSLESNRRYRIGANYADRNGTNGVTGSVEITINNQTRELSADWDREERGVFWVPAIIEGDGSITQVDEFLE